MKKTLLLIILFFIVVFLATIITCKKCESVIEKKITNNESKDFVIDNINEEIKNTIDNNHNQNTDVVTNTETENSIPVDEDIVNNDTNNNNTNTDTDPVVPETNPPPKNSDIVSPTISMVTPTPNQILVGTRTLRASASDDIGVTKVDFYYGDTFHKTDYTQPYEVALNTVNLPNGNMNFYAKAYDAYGNTSTSDAVTAYIWNGQDLPPLSISNVFVINILQNSAKIIWNTNLGADSQIEYGTTVSYGNTTTLDPALVTAHSVSLSGLTLSTEYHFRVKSGSLYSGDYTFKTQATVFVDDGSVEYGITIGYMDIIFKIDDDIVSIKPEGQKALDQIKKDGFTRLRMMEPFAGGFMKNFPSLPAQAVKILQDQGFKVLISLNGSPFTNGNTTSIDSWVYRFFPGTDGVSGSDDDAGLGEHVNRLTQFMDALKAQGSLNNIDIQLFDEPNAPQYFWGTYEEWEQLLTANINVLKRSEYGLTNEHIWCCAFTSNLMNYGQNMVGQEKYWDFVKNYKTNSLVKNFPFSFHWYPVAGIGPSSDNFVSSDIKLSPMYRGAWITEMNVDSSMSINKLYGTSEYYGYRYRDLFRDKVYDIFTYAKLNQIKGVYLFNIKTKTDIPDSYGNIGFGLFNFAGCPRWEYKVLLEILGRTIDFGSCPMPRITDF
jgi:hypothetical protein